MAGSSRTVGEAGKHSDTCKLLPSASKWNSLESDLNVSLPSPYSKSYDFELVIADKTHYKRFLCISFALSFLVLALGLVLHFLPHKNHHHPHSNNLTLAVNRALTFFDAQKSGSYPSNSPINFRASSGLQDGNSSNIHADLVGGFYDSGNNIKFTFPTAYTITLLSWSVIEYHRKYADIGELEHIKDVIKWGSDYLLKVFVPPSAKSDSTVLFSQVGSAGYDTKNPVPNDINCWQRPEDMSYERPVSVCNETASDLAGEIVAALAAASIVFKQDNGYSQGLVKTAERIYEATEKADRNRRAVSYTTIDACGGEARKFYDSSGYTDELVWGATWLFFATGNHTYLDYATTNFAAAADNQTVEDKGIFYWNNKITANAVLFTRLRFFRDLGFPYEKALGLSSNMTEQLMCSYLSDKYFNTTPGGLILLRPDDGGQLQFAATASFLSKLYNDYLTLLHRSGWNCTNDGFSLEMLQSFSTSQISYILGDNPRKMSYMVGFGDRYPTRVHHRSASIPWDGQYHSCAEGNRWLNSSDQNPNILLGAIVAGPDRFDDFSDERDKPWFTEPSIASNAGLVAALIAHHDPPRSSSSNGPTLGLDLMGIFEKVQFKS
ncbi:DEFECTIVE CYTOKINESIS, glycosyl hydrolase 9A1, KORRIGAN, RADIALLY SWOLLEN 2 [Hibiscus trionum]|uniref:Endoglucanase n=1 Tax=Hibiscus trionum TaxID=183268 RepID=A0A9W7LTM9_HIBTR|nr:DEFECTIVE CYTOKINESIS, glycosyl hydrolase 9A1, KORRIGAN, RADIALLY SWOLLEN 2 [Hibiscus trionum]